VVATRKAHKIHFFLQSSPNDPRKALRKGLRKRCTNRWRNEERQSVHGQRKDQRQLVMLFQ
jgi:hypothetical protein